MCNQQQQQQQHRAGGAEVGACTASPRPVDTGACEKGVREDDSCKGGVSRGRGASGEGPGSIVGGVAAAAIVGGAEIKALRAKAIIKGHVCSGSCTVAGVSWEGAGRELSWSWEGAGRELAGSWQGGGRELGGSWQGAGREQAEQQLYWQQRASSLRPESIRHNPL